MPDPSAVRDAAVNSLGAAREATSSLSTNLYREVKGLTSSELEQVMLKATRPDDAAVKGKHVERLVGITYQISTKFDIYDSVLRKLWAKMAEKDWRTTIKALYILHRFSADGSAEHGAALKVCYIVVVVMVEVVASDKLASFPCPLVCTHDPQTIPYFSHPYHSISYYYHVGKITRPSPYQG